MNYAIILAGGIGSRFWPLSTDSEPKQFLKVSSDKPMIEETLQRIKGIIKKENIYIAANKSHKQNILNYARKFNIPLRNLLFEPESRNTFAPIAFLSQKILSYDNDAAISVLPCDHVIKYARKFIKCLSQAYKISETGNIVCFGIIPKRAETGYGYIKIKKPETKNQKIQIYDIERFIEKPNLAKAKEFIKDKRFFWNSGIFIFKAKTLLEEIRRLFPDTSKYLMSNEPLNSLWVKLPDISIDYAVMEKTKKIVLMPVDYGWIDLGSWQAIEEVLKKDKNNNIFRGNNIIDLNTKNTIIWGNKRLIATVGIKDIIIVDTDNAILVCAKDKTQDVKKIAYKINKLKSQN
ncbi:MAG: sugar phosphate nucleotidyltransferase [Candidatus Omnitrophota bacterium]